MSDGPSISPVRRATRGVTLPVRRALDPRFADIVRRVTDLTAGVAREAQETREQLSRIGSSVASHAEAVIELAAHVGDRLDRFDADVEAIDQRLDALEAEFSGRMLPQRLREVAEVPPEKLDADAAEYLNLATGQDGPAARAGLWIAAPVRLGHRAGGVHIAEVTRAAVDEPWVLQALAGLPSGARIHVASSTPRSLPLTLAILGHTVEMLDAPVVPHERITSDIAPRGCAAVVALGTLDAGDREATLTALQQQLEPDAPLLLSIRVGVPIDANNDVLEVLALPALLDGWTITDRLDIARTSPTRWEATSAIPADGLVLVRLVPPTR